MHPSAVQDHVFVRNFFFKNLTNFDGEVRGPHGAGWTALGMLADKMCLFLPHGEWLPLQLVSKLSRGI